MTRDEIMSMEPGREFDALVAVKLMGYEISSAEGHTSNNSLCVRNIQLDVGINYKKDVALNFRNIHHNHPAPKYSTEISAAWEVVEKLNQDSFIVQVFSGGRLIACRIRNSKTGEEVDAEAKTAPEAICKSALLAVMGVEK